MTLVIYASKYGTTRQYAQWIAEELQADLQPVQKVTEKTLLRYDTVIFGGAVYNGVIQGIRFVKKHLRALKERRLILFTVGLTMPGDDAAFQAMLDRNLTREEQAGIRTRYFLGAIRFKKLNPKEKMMLWLLKTSIAKKSARSPIEADLLEYYNGELDYANRTYVGDLVREAQPEE